MLSIARTSKKHFLLRNIHYECKLFNCRINTCNFLVGEAMLREAVQTGMQIPQELGILSVDNPSVTLRHTDGKRFPARIRFRRKHAFSIQTADDD